VCEALEQQVDVELGSRDEVAARVELGHLAF
jgi:hypothetical protein